MSRLFSVSVGWLLGVEEAPDKSLHVTGVPDGPGYAATFWATVGDPAKVSANILAPEDVALHTVEGKQILVISVPRANRHQRPVYIGESPFTGSYRRDGEGDYHCSPEEVRAMLRDREDAPADLAVLEGRGPGDLVPGDVRQFRALMAMRQPDHPWNYLPDERFLPAAGILGPGQGGGLHPTLAGLLLLTVMSRTLFLSAITWIYGYRNVIPVAMFFGMVPTSEIAFIVIQEGSRPNVNLFDSAVYSLILCIVVCSMILGPAVDNLTSPVYRLLQKTIWKKSPRLDTVTIPEPDLRNHVILAGGGAVGRSIAHLLSRLQLPYIIIDSDHRSFQESQKEKLVAIYGDPQQDVILNSAGIDRAKILLSISSGFSENLSIIRSARMLHPSIPIITLADSAEEVRMLHGYKIYEIVQPKFEAGLEITRQALLRLDVPALEVQNYLDGVRHDQYKPLLDGKADYRLLTRLRSFIGIVELNWVLLPEESFIAGKTLADSRIRSLCGVSVVGAMRDGSFISNPSPDFLLKAGDLLAVIGTAAQRTRFEHLAGAEMAATPAAAGHEVFESAQPAEQHS